jgi:Glycosyltransferase family 28 N-terminal domain
MQIVVAAYGSRGDVEPCAAVALELLRRDHDVRMAVPPNLLGFVESAGLAGVAYGPDSREEWNPGSDLVRNIAPRMQNPISVVPEVVEHVTQVKVQKGAELSALAKGGDLVLASFNEQGLAANVAEYYGVPVAALHPFPERIWSSDWLFSRMTKAAEELNAGLWAYRRQPDPRLHRWRSRPTTSSACPSRQPNGSKQIAGGPSSGRSHWSCRRTPTTRSCRGLPREHRPSTSALAVRRSRLPLTRSP